MPLDTHNMREKQTKQKMIVGFLKNVMFTSILRLVRGSPTTLQKIRLVLRGAKREKKETKGRLGGKDCSSTLVLKGLTTMGKYNVRATLLRSLLHTGRADKGLYNV
jgi:hypothetical protein